MTPTLTTSTNLARQLLSGLLAALFAWGIYLAVGSFRHGVVQGAIVLTCSVVFLVSWMVAMYGRSRRLHSADQTLGNRLNLPSVCGLGCALIAAVAYTCAIRTFNSNAVSARVWFGWTALGAVAVGTVASIVGLSNPRPKGGKLAGLCALVLFLAIFATFIVRSSMPPQPAG